MPPPKMNIFQAVDAQIQNIFQPHIVGDVNGLQVKVAKFGEVFDWHSHPQEDAAFFVLRGRIAFDVGGGTVELGEGDYLTVPHTGEHRPRSLTIERVVVMSEPTGTLNTGDAPIERNVAEPKRMEPVQ